MPNSPVAGEGELDPDLLPIEFDFQSYFEYYFLYITYYTQYNIYIIYIVHYILDIIQCILYMYICSTYQRNKTL